MYAYVRMCIYVCTHVHNYFCITLNRCHFQSGLGMWLAVTSDWLPKPLLYLCLIICLLMYVYMYMYVYMRVFMHENAYVLQRRCFVLKKD